MEIVILNSTLDVCIIKAANKGNEIDQYNLGVFYETEDNSKIYKRRSTGIKRQLKMEIKVHK
jgi:hypothetical protein